MTSLNHLVKCSTLCKFEDFKLRSSSLKWLFVSYPSSLSMIAPSSLGGVTPPLYTNFPVWVHWCVVAWVHISQTLVDELTIAMKIKVINLDENIPKRRFGYLWDPGRT